jgi:hypothetical protein
MEGFSAKLYGSPLAFRFHEGEPRPPGLEDPV